MRDDIIGEKDFHGAVFYRELMDRDVTYHFIESIEEKFDDADAFVDEEVRIDISPRDELERISSLYGVRDINLIKPGIGETTRVLLRRMPRKLLVHSLKDDLHLGHLYQLAGEKGVEMEEYPLKNYRACGIIKTMADT